MQSGFRLSLALGFLVGVLICGGLVLAAVYALNVFQERVGTPTASRWLPSPTLVVTQSVPEPLEVTATTAVLLSTPSATPSSTSIPLPSATPMPTVVPLPTATPTVAPPSPTPYAGPFRFDNGPDLVVLYAVSPPDVDGRLDEWAGQVDINLGYIELGADRFDGGADLRASVMARWDTNALYLAFWVVDDVHVQTEQGYWLYQGDDLEFWLDSDLPGDFDNASANKDDYQLGFSAGDFAGLPPEAVVWLPQRRDEWNRAIRIAAWLTPNGYTLEAAVPWWLFDITPTTGMVFGYAVSVSDNDVSGTAQQETVLATSPHMKWGEPTTFGNMRLE
ncbi:MAG TPA: hypothetical protein EYH31_00035 [Anaerolineae bacterium]|nr:hypothetical protein [Anaerolineae bacterium]